MIPARFGYVRAASLAHAIETLAADEDARALAGGHSLVPLLKLRFATPSVLVDLGRLDDLRYIREEDGQIAIGALTTHHQLATDPLVARRTGLLATVAAEIGDPQVRHRGTIGGSVAHGDPASDLPAALLALEAEYVITGPSSVRVVPASEFHLGFWQTALSRGELLTEVRVPAGSGGHAFRKFRVRAMDWAVVGVAAARTPAAIGVALINMCPTPLRARSVEAALAAGADPATAASHAADDTEPPADHAASAAFRAHLARVLTAEVLTELAGGAGGPGGAGSGAAGSRPAGPALSPDRSQED